MKGALRGCVRHSEHSQDWLKCSTQAACRPACPPATVSIRNTPSSPQRPPGAAPAKPPPPPAAPCCPRLRGTGRPGCCAARQAGAVWMIPSHGRFQGTECASQPEAQHSRLRVTLLALNQGTRSSGTSTKPAPGAEWPERTACKWPAPYRPALQHTTQQASDLVCGRRPATQLVHGSHCKLGVPKRRWSGGCQNMPLACQQSIQRVGHSSSHPVQHLRLRRQPSCASGS